VGARGRDAVVNNPKGDLSRRLQHLAISADGNGRWAEQRGLPRSAGHEHSQKAFRSVLESCVEFEIPYLSLHVFSSENWARPGEEVSYIIDLFTRVLSSVVEPFREIGVRFRWSGSTASVPEGLIELLRSVEEQTADNSALTLQFCLNYGGRSEIVDAVRRLTRDVSEGAVDMAKVDETTFRKYLYCPDIPDVDLFVRPAGEFRLSNFLLWQLAYAELVFTEELWPDFNRETVASAIHEFIGRRRKFGLIE
jgi:undecaprenyl diphosphate synthase